MVPGLDLTMIGMKHAKSKWKIKTKEYYYYARSKKDVQI